MIADVGDITGPALADRAGVPPTRGRTHTDRLVAGGLVTRHGELLVITPKGRRTAERLIAAHAAALGEHVEHWTPETTPNQQKSSPAWPAPASANTATPDLDSTLPIHE
ncbi:MarR family winged helix-turn-helix transcriptional regulator [Spongiactinospora sp. TRM90649]|uniref:MarR family winged helix-turn-helix transcriptional regulator n=1 Tax=Spongiactinospora sp. TRM90649 TaxID=3031114 RepID=UPI0023F77737|nr:MarR family winged helix-turn-helix transcriptional regulator [Spongiactinospora sp. TRM90649]MDF5757614.1 MarR family winged helix-turn-helix transcriptional regulator [Spongiactinospora sp. TRM90649]